MIFQPKFILKFLIVHDSMTDHVLCASALFPSEIGYLSWVLMHYASKYYEVVTIIHELINCIIRFIINALNQRTLKNNILYRIIMCKGFKCYQNQQLNWSLVFGWPREVSFLCLWAKLHAGIGLRSSGLVRNSGFLLILS